MMDPYETDPTKVPVTDPYADIPFYGRYQPCSGEFVPNPPPGASTSEPVIRYWESVILDRCIPANRMYEIEGWRDVFALGSVIVKSSHLSTAPPPRDHAWSDANECAAIALAGDYLRRIGIQVPKIHFQGKINQRDVVVQSRIPGVGLNVAWPYLTSKQKASFKQQAREIIAGLYDGVSRPSSIDGVTPSYAVSDPDPVRSRTITETELDLLFGKTDGVDKRKPGFVHNDFNESNIIVQDGKIVGLIDWEMAGFFGLDRVGNMLCVGLRNERIFRPQAWPRSRLPT